MAEKQMKQKVKAKKGAKKSFYEVTSQITATKIQLYASEPEALHNKTVKIDLTKNLRGKSLELVLRVKADGQKLVANPEKLYLVGSYVRKAVRKGTDYAEDSFEAECRNARVRVKPLFVTRRRVSRAVLAALRDAAQKFLISHLKTRDDEEIFSEIIANKLQKQLALKLKTIYPLALCEIRMFETLGPLKEKKTVEVQAQSKE